MGGTEYDLIVPQTDLITSGFILYVCLQVLCVGVIGMAMRTSHA
jgi:hypothetical protein